MQCKNLHEIRMHIDRIDNEIVQKIAARENYVVQAATFKKAASEVEAKQRVEEVIAAVRRKAASYGANQDLVEKIYRNMIDGFIHLEMDAFKHQ